MPRMSPQARIEERLQQCREIQYDRPMDALVFAEDALGIARKFKLKERVLHCQRMIGICHYAHHDYEAALTWFERALPGYRTLRDRSGESRALQNIALTQRQLGRNEEALSTLRRSEHIVRDLHDDAYLMTVLTSIGSSCSLLGRHKEALQAYSECLTIAERTDDAGMRARITGNIADVYLGIGDTETAIDWSKRSLALHRENNDAMGIGLTLSNLGRVYQHIGDLDAALAVMSEALVVMTTINDAHARARIMVFLATILLQKRRLAQAQTMAEEALDIFVNTHDHEREVRCRMTLAEVAAIRGTGEETRQQLAHASKRMRTITNASLEIEINQRQAELMVAEGAKERALKTLLRGARLAAAQAMHGATAAVERRIAEIYASMSDHRRALEHERRASAAQQAADTELRAQHSQALQLRLDMEREARERERMQAANEKLTFQLTTKERELNLNVLAIAQKNELLSDLSANLQAAVREKEPERTSMIRQIIRTIDMHRRTGEDWRNFNEQLADVHDTFIQALTAAYPTLTGKEVQLASLLKLNLSSKEIAQVLSVGVASVEVYRSNLRKKLGLDSGTSLTTFIQSIG